VRARAEREETAVYQGTSDHHQASLQTFVPKKRYPAASRPSSSNALHSALDSLRLFQRWYAVGQLVIVLAWLLTSTDETPRPASATATGIRQRRFRAACVRLYPKNHCSERLRLILISIIRHLAGYTRVHGSAGGLLLEKLRRNRSR